MKKFPLILLIIAALMTFMSTTSCGGDDDKIDYDAYREWLANNNEWLAGLENLNDAAGEKVYTRVVPDYNRGVFILMRWFNDTEKTKGNLMPFLTSTVDVKYIGFLYNNEPFDSSYLQTANGDSIFRTSLQSVIEGWQIALQQMHVGDSVEVIIPYQVGYGTNATSDIPAFSNLRFGIKLVDIHGYEIK